MPSARSNLWVMGTRSFSPSRPTPSGKLTCSRLLTIQYLSLQARMSPLRLRLRGEILTAHPHVPQIPTPLNGKHSRFFGLRTPRIASFGTEYSTLRLRIENLVSTQSTGEEEIPTKAL